MVDTFASHYESGRWGCCLWIRPISIRPHLIASAKVHPELKVLTSARIVIKDDRWNDPLKLRLLLSRILCKISSSSIFSCCCSCQKSSQAIDKGCGVSYEILNWGWWEHATKLFAAIHIAQPLQLRFLVAAMGFDDVYGGWVGGWVL